MSEQTSWIETRLPVAATLRAHVTGILVPRDMPYSATFAALVTGAVIFLILSGVVLSVYYDPWHAFDSIQFIIREVNFGWLIHGFHATGTTMLFGAMYLLLFRAILGREYKAPGELVWFLKLIVLLLLLLTGYLGFTLADGAQSYWSLHSSALAVSQMGGLPGSVGAWFFGGPAGPSTLARLVVLHMAIALVVVVVVAIHLAAKRAIARIPGRPVALHPYYTSQYFVAFTVFGLIFAVLVFFAPHLGESRLNLVPASGLVVPDTIVPPWYLLPETGIANTAATAMGHMINFVAAIAVLFALPWLDLSKPGTPPKFLSRVLTYVLALDLIALAITQTAASSLLTGILSVLFTAWYFLHFLVLVPLATATESN
jgi:ubiquinol-cytochrome c reductase cytochrome b subunit